MAGKPKLASSHINYNLSQHIGAHRIDRPWGGMARGDTEDAIVKIYVIYNM